MGGLSVGIEADDYMCFARYLLIKIAEKRGMSINFESNPVKCSWNVSKLTKIEYMFDNAGAFNQPICSWKVSKVSNVGNMFLDTTAFNQPIMGFTP